MFHLLVEEVELELKTCFCLLFSWNFARPIVTVSFPTCSIILRCNQQPCSSIYEYTLHICVSSVAVYIHIYYIYTQLRNKNLCYAILPIVGDIQQICFFWPKIDFLLVRHFVFQIFSFTPKQIKIQFPGPKHYLNDNLRPKR